MPDRRLYAQFTLDYADSHKIAPLSDAAFRAHVRMILWSRRMLTDGRIPAAMALVLADRKKKVLHELTTNDPEAPSLLLDSNGDYLLHDFLDHQQSAAQVETNRQQNRANGAKGGAAKAARTHGGQPPEPPPSSSEPLANGYRTVSEPPPDDDRPPSGAVPDFYTETETYNSSTSTRPVLETAISPDDDDGSRVRSAYWRAWKISNPTALIARIAQAVERPVTEQQAVEIVAGILARSKTKPRSVQAYVESSVRQSWAEIQQELDEAAVAA